MGRLWKNKRIISFWQPYPTPIQMKQVIHDIENTETVKRVGRVWVKIKIKINPTQWLLDQEPTNPGGWEETVLKPLSEYLNSNITPSHGQFQDHIHGMSPIEKEKLKQKELAAAKSEEERKSIMLKHQVPAGVGSKHMKGGMPTTQYNKLRYPHVDENILPKRVLYSAVILNEKSQAALLDTFKRFLPQGWKTYAHHMTIEFGKPLRHPKDKGKNVELTATELGISDKCIAVKVDGYDSANKVPHITLAVSPNGKPKDSNDITDWQQIQPVVLYGTIEEIQ